MSLTTCCGKSPVFQSNEEKLITQRLTLFKHLGISTPHVSHGQDMSAEIRKSAANALQARRVFQRFANIKST